MKNPNIWRQNKTVPGDVTNSVVWFGTNLETPFSKSPEQTDIKLG